MLAAVFSQRLRAPELRREHARHSEVNMYAARTSSNQSLQPSHSYFELRPLRICRPRIGSLATSV